MVTAVDRDRLAGEVLAAVGLQAAIELENRTQVLGTFTRNMTEAGRAFVEKRDPTWNPM